MDGKTCTRKRIQTSEKKTKKELSGKVKKDGKRVYLK